MDENTVGTPSTKLYWNFAPSKSLAKKKFTILPNFSRNIICLKAVAVIEDIHL